MDNYKKFVGEYLIKAEFVAGTEHDLRVGRRPNQSNQFMEQTTLEKTVFLVKILL